MHPPPCKYVIPWRWRVSTCPLLSSRYLTYSRFPRKICWRIGWWIEEINGDQCNCLMWDFPWPLEGLGANLSSSLDNYHFGFWVYGGWIIILFRGLMSGQVWWCLWERLLAWQDRQWHWLVIGTGSRASGLEQFQSPIKSSMLQHRPQECDSLEESILDATWPGFQDVLWSPAKFHAQFFPETTVSSGGPGNVCRCLRAQAWGPSGLTAPRRTSCIPAPLSPYRVSCDLI